MAHPASCTAASIEIDNDATVHAALEAILATLRQRTGADFSAYRRATVLRRIRNRMISVGASSMEAYAGLLAERPDEPEQLLQRITIKVSRFYRNAPAFDRLHDEVLPALAAAARGRALRIWSAGCGCGEEPYTLAMLLQSLGVPGSVLATDIDEAALARAREARYPAEAAAELPAQLRACLQQDGECVRVAPATRALVRFARHDLGSTAPPEAAAFDLVVCRNVLIYFDRPLQQRAFDLLQSRLAAGGALFLGEAEWPPLSQGSALQSLCRSSRLFRVPELAA